MTYKWRFKPIRFGEGPAPNYGITQTFEFESHTDFKKWHRNRTIGLAELDEAMNFCQYFVRTKGNDGFYEREGKRFPVKGTIVGIQDMWCKHDNKDYFCCSLKPFCNFLAENGWKDNWFKLHERYAMG